MLKLIRTGLVSKQSSLFSGWIIFCLLAFANLGLSLGQIRPPDNYCAFLDPEFLVAVDSILDRIPEKYRLPQNHERVRNAGNYIAKANWLSFAEKVKLMNIFLERTTYKGGGSFKYLRGSFKEGTLFYYHVYLLRIDSTGAVSIARLPSNFPQHLRNSENLPSYLADEQYKIDWKMIE